MPASDKIQGVGKLGGLMNFTSAISSDLESARHYHVLLPHNLWLAACRGGVGLASIASKLSESSCHNQTDVVPPSLSINARSVEHEEVAWKRSASHFDE